MKTILSLCAFFLVISSSFALTPMPENLTANLETARFDAYSPYSSRGFSGGEIKIDQDNGEILLTLFLNPVCPTGAMCITIIDVEKVKLPLVSVRKDQCGAVHFLGESGDKNMQVVDHSSNHCLDGVPNATTYIEYNATYADPELGYLFDTRSSFTAGKLKMRTRFPHNGTNSAAQLR